MPQETDARLASGYTIKVRAYAKVNLTLDVLGKRPDGYHELESIMQSIGLYDTLEFKNASSGVQIHCSHPEVPADESNLVYKAARALQERFGLAGGAEIRLEKAIPVAAGLAGGSADAAGALVGLNALWGLHLSQRELGEVAAGLGSDVNFCLTGGTALAQGRGERITVLPAAPNFWLVLLKPRFGVSTAEVYRGLDLKAVEPLRPDTVAMLNACVVNDFDAMAAGLRNVLESVTCRLHPELNELKEALLRAGASGALISGSGPTVFGVVPDEEGAGEVAAALMGIKATRYVTSTHRKGVEVERTGGPADRIGQGAG
ncbi:MAG: 4-(cytidine 5'-diphospho)-2-C-methyl-D-erythritol kinase [Firmicutes bacterium]|nr:4-(cytidine 5'-diphospho)-2-C-methyl-D-erythritol kinase [Bacillota bacterium]